MEILGIESLWVFVVFFRMAAFLFEGLVVDFRSSFDVRCYIRGMEMFYKNDGIICGYKRW